MRRLTPIILLVAAAALAFLPLFADSFRIDQASRILIYVILAASLDLLVGYTGLVSLGHAAFFGVATYAAALLADRAEIANVFIALPLSMLGAALTALVIGALTIRLKGVYFIMVTLAFTQIVFFLLHDTTWAGGSDGILAFVDVKAEIAGFTLLNLSDLHQRFYFTLGVTVLVLLGLLRLVHSPFGTVLQGIRENERRMRALGYRVDRYRLICFVIGGTLSGLAGYLYFALTNFADPTLTYWLHSAQILIMTVLGGLGTLIGPAFGAAFLTLFIDWSSEMTELWKLYLGIVVVAVTLFSGGGLWNGLTRLVAALSALRKRRGSNA